MTALRGVVALLRSVEAGRDAMNETKTSWNELARATAEKTDIRDIEKQDAGREISERIARFVLRSVSFRRAAISSKDRLRGFGADWEIQGIKDAPRAGRNAIEITALRME